MRFASLSIVVAVPLAFALAYGCGGSTPSSFNNGGDDGGTSDALTNDETPAFGGDSGNETGTTCAVSCSSDLHSVLDCNNNVVTMCPADQGCDPTSGACIPACDSAKANKGSIGCELHVLAR